MNRQHLSLAVIVSRPHGSVSQYLSCESSGWVVKTPQWTPGVPTVPGALLADMNLHGGLTVIRVCTYSLNVWIEEPFDPLSTACYEIKIPSYFIVIVCAKNLFLSFGIQARLSAWLKVVHGGHSSPPPPPPPPPSPFTWCNQCHLTPPQLAASSLVYGISLSSTVTVLGCQEGSVN